MAEPSGEAVARIRVVVRCHDPALSLAWVVGVVEVHRLMVKAHRTAS